ncbi:hypothetical protein BHE74_00026449 [Ensete ventricosum]|nr:hypothetical protein GW17_00008444 [Ensete ventricosum]RWW66192.1 hypothetical protein BHE74_00026449 [Ensete ventricosum]
MCSTRVTPTAPKSDFSETSQERSRRRGRGSDSLASFVDREERGGGGEVRFARDRHAAVRGLRAWDERDVSHEVGFTRERDP